MIRKFVIVAATAATLSIPAFAQEGAKANPDQGEGAIGWTAAQAGLFAPVSFPYGNNWDVSGFDLNLFYGVNARLNGVGLGAFVMRTTDELRGVAIAPLCNWNEKDVYGVRISSVLNYSGANVYGLDIGGLFSFRNGGMKGIEFNGIGSHQQRFVGFQASGVCNLIIEDGKGVSATMGLNFAREMQGAQLGGINFAQRLNGCQIGFFNVAEECPCGLQLGFVNIIMDNPINVFPVVNFFF